MSTLHSWSKWAADLPAPMTTTVPPHLNLGSENSTIGSRIRDTGSPLPLPPVNGAGAVLGHLTGLPTFRGMYSPQQFKIPQYGSESALRQNIAAADQYRQKAQLPQLKYDKIFEQVPLYQGPSVSGGFVPFNETQKTLPVFMNDEPAVKSINSGSNTTAWFNGLTSTRDEQQAAMSGKPAPGGFLNSLFQRARGDRSEALNDWKQYGALARSYGLPATPENAGKVLANTTNSSISGGNPNDTLNDQNRVLEHELGHTWLQNPVVADGTPAAKIEDAVSNGVGRSFGPFSTSGNVRPPWYSSLKSLIGHDANLPEFLNYGSALQGHMFRTTGKRLETPDAVKQWTDKMLGAPDEPTFEQNLQSYPFDVRRMMRHNWRLQQGSGNDDKKALLEQLKQRMQLWFPSLVSHPAAGPVKVATLGRIAGAIGKATNYMARVPAGQSFAPTISQGLRNSLRVGFNPYLGQRLQLPKKILQGATLFGLGKGVYQARNQISDIGRTTDDLVPDLPQTQAAKSYAQSLRDWPLWTAARTAVGGLPSDIPPDQRDFITRLGSLGIKSKIHSAGIPATWGDMAKSVYKPAMPAAASAFQKLLQYFIPAPTPVDYLGLAGSGYRMIRPQT